MQNQWQKLFIKLTIWLAAEILLNWLGLDDLADYSEFLASDKSLSQFNAIVPGLVTDV